MQIQLIQITVHSVVQLLLISAVLKSAVRYINILSNTTPLLS